MHPDDQMTPLQRAKALKNGQTLDRLPIGMTYGTPAASLLGWSRRYGDATARRCADKVKKAYEVFGADGVGTSLGLHGLGMAYGAELSDPEFAAPAILHHPVADIADLSGLAPDKLTVESDLNAKKCYEVVQILLEELGQEVGCGFCVPGVFTAASSLVGVPQLLRALRRKPEAVHKLMDFATQELSRLAQSFLALEVSISIADPVASGTMISKAHFDEFVAPYAIRFVQACETKRPFGVSCHICGDTTGILESIAACGYSNVDVDNAVSLEQAKQRIGDVVHISGNVNPAGALFLGTPEQVRAEVRACFAAAWDSPKGFTICTGCDSAWGTPLENSLSFVSEARRCAKMPLNPGYYYSAAEPK